MRRLRNWSWMLADAPSPQCRLIREIRVDAPGTATAKYSRHAIAGVVVCGCLIALINFGVRASFGLFTGPISAANGWGRDVFTLALAVCPPIRPSFPGGQTRSILS